MAFVPIANSCQAELRLTYVGSQVCYTLGFYNSGGVTQPNLQTLADRLSEWWYNTLRSRCSAGVGMREVYCRDLTSESGPTATSTTRAGTTGTLSAGTNMPGNVALVVSFRTALRGRANRGRNYWCGFGSTQMGSTHYVTSAYSATVVAAYQAILPGGAYDPTPYRWVVNSRQLNGVATGRAVPITTVLVVDNGIDSMRTRLPGRGL